MKKHTVKDDPPQPWVHRFGELPVIEASIYAINPEIPAEFLLSEAQYLVESMAEVASDGAHKPITSASAWMLERNLRCVEAILGRLETQVKRSNAGFPLNQREAA